MSWIGRLVEGTIEGITKGMMAGAPRSIGCQSSGGVMSVNYDPYYFAERTPLSQPVFVPF